MNKFIRLQKINVSFLTTSYPLHPDASSGIFVKRLVDALRRSSNVTVITPDDSATYSYPKEVKAFHYAPKEKQLLAHSNGGIPIALKKKKINYFYAVLLVGNFLLTTIKSARHADIIHANWSVPGIIAGLVGGILNKPAITTLRGEDVTRAKSSMLFKIFLYCCIASNNSVICVSTEMQEELRILFPRHKGKILHIPNGIDTAFFVDRRTKSTRSDKKTCILCVGSLIPRKNFSSVVQAISQSIHRDTIQLNIVGEGPDRPSLEHQVEMQKLSKSVTFLGNVSPAKIHYLYELADIFIIPSLSEGRPNVLLEAMASGLAIIASKIAGITEIIEDGTSGLLFCPLDHKNLTRLIDELISSVDARNKLANNAQRYIQENCNSWEDTAEEYLQVYHSLINRSSA